MKTVLCKCHQCDTPFDKSKSEWKRSERLGKKHFCSLGCSCAYGNTKPRPRHTSHLQCDNKLDDLSPFRRHLALSKRRSQTGPDRSQKGRDCNLTLEYLKELWDKQEGKCPFTGWDLVRQRTTDQWEDGPKIRRASIDRIDNSKGYVKGNVRFVCTIFNYARNDFKDSEVLEFCRAAVVNA